MKKLLITGIVVLLLLCGIGTAITVNEKNERQRAAEEEKIALNEIVQLAVGGNTQTAENKANLLRNRITAEQNRSMNVVWLVLGFAGAVLVLIFLYVYVQMVRPFRKLQDFAAQLARGDFDTGLPYFRGNYFGDFTWAFDNMRHEIVKARKQEKEAIENNKTVIASLSHDIKTPVASLRAYTEGLAANMDTTPEKRQKYLEVIMRKCDDIARLTNDMTLHSLTGLDKLRVQCEPVDLKAIVTETVADIMPDSDKIRVHLPDEPLKIRADAGRVSQIIENVLNNADKYAGTQIDLNLYADKGQDAVLEIRDYGPGIPDEDMPFIFDKFYRGHNIGNRPGSGLGLYIVRYLLEKQEATIEVQNANPGLAVRMRFAAEGQ